MWKVGVFRLEMNIKLRKYSSLWVCIGFKIICMIYDSFYEKVLFFIFIKFYYIVLY